MTLRGRYDREAHIPRIDLGANEYGQMARFLLAEPAESDFSSLTEALDQTNIGILLLDHHMRARFLNRRLIEMFDLAPALLARGPTFRDLLEHAAAKSCFAVPASDLSTWLDQRDASVRSGSIPVSHIDLQYGRRILFGCNACPDGGRILTYADVSAELRPEALDELARINAELRFSNETMEDHAARLATLAEATDETARDLADAKHALEREVAERRLLESELRQMATIDGLTGALNRAGFLTHSQIELERFRASGGNLTILMLDVDHFKSVNDLYGHAGGDQALRHLVAVIGKRIRRSDLLGRLGGEEFAILLPVIAPKEAEALAKRLAALVAATPVTYGDQSISLTVSIGVAFATPADHSVEKIIARADDALYRAKEAGRNRVVSERSVWPAGDAVDAAR